MDEGSVLKINLLSEEEDFFFFFFFFFICLFLYKNGFEDTSPTAPAQRSHG